MPSVWLSKQKTNVFYLISITPKANWIFLKPHFEAKRQSVLDGAAAATNAIQQGNIMNLIGLGMAMSTSSAAANQGGAVAGNTVSASNTLENFGNIEAICNDPSNQSAITEVLN